MITLLMRYSLFISVILYRKMKVLLIDVYNYNKGGAETVCFNTGKLLEEHGHQVVYFTLKWEENNPSPYSKYFPESKETRKGL